jgi:hypothetical protein
MNLTFEQLRAIKHSLPTGGVKRIAEELNISEQSVRNYFGANKFEDGSVPGISIEWGPDGDGVVHLEDTTILDLAQKIIEEENASKEV